MDERESFFVLIPFPTVGESQREKRVCSEWSNKQNFLRQASRMCQRDQNRQLNAFKLGEARQQHALNLCKKFGMVVDYLEERNEMSETPLIREAADGRAHQVLLLLEAGADRDACGAVPAAFLNSSLGTRQLPGLHEVLLHRLF